MTAPSLDTWVSRRLHRDKKRGKHSFLACHLRTAAIDRSIRIFCCYSLTRALFFRKIVQKPPLVRLRYSKCVCASSWAGVSVSPPPFEVHGCLYYMPVETDSLGRSKLHSHKSRKGKKMDLWILSSVPYEALPCRIMQPDMSYAEPFTGRPPAAVARFGRTHPLAPLCLCACPKARRTNSVQFGRYLDVWYKSAGRARYRLFLVAPGWRHDSRFSVSVSESVKSCRARDNLTYYECCMYSVLRTS